MLFGTIYSHGLLSYFLRSFETNLPEMDFEFTEP